MNFRRWTFDSVVVELLGYSSRREVFSYHFLQRLSSRLILGIAIMLPWLVDARGAELGLNWLDNSSNESGFRIERRTGSAVFQPIAAVEANATSFRDVTVIREHEYSYRICAFNALGDSDYAYSSSVVVPPASVPGLGALANLKMELNQESGSLNFSVSDPRVESARLEVTAHSSNQTLLPDTAIQVAGQGDGRSITVRPRQGVVGQATVTINVTNGERASSSSFVLTVNLPATLQQGSTSAPSLIGPRSYFSNATAESPFSVGLQVDAGQVATLLLSGTGIGRRVVLSGFSLAPGVTYTHDVEGLGTVAVSASLDSATISIPSLGRVIVASPDAAKDVASVRSGIFTVPLCHTSEGRIDILVGQGGRAMVVVSHNGLVLAGQGEVQPDGLATVQLSGGGSISLFLADGGALTGTAILGGVTFPVLGRWDGTAPRSRLVNLSARSTVSPGEGLMVAGFTISGSGSNSLLVRAVGPGLSVFGISNFLADPRFEIRRVGAVGTSDVLGMNDNWQLAPGAGSGVAQGAFPLQVGSLDSALFVAATAGGYTVETTGNGVGSGTALVEVYDADAAYLADGAGLTNLSVRARIGVGDDVAVVGFAISGDMPKRILLRAVGPELSQYGMSGVLQDPQISLFEATVAGAHLIAEKNDITSADADAADAAGKAGAFPLGSTSRSAALAIWLPPGAYTAVARAGSSSVGVGLVEVYDIP